MENYFKGTVSYMEEGADKKTTKNFMVDSLTFTEAEANLTKYMTDIEDVQDFVIKTLTRVSFDEVLFLREMEEFDWYVATVKMALDGEKETGFKYLIAGESMKDVTSMLTEHMKDSDGEFRIPKVSEEPLGDIILAKHCDILGTMIVSFLDQRTIDLKQINFELLEELHQKTMEELGAFHLTPRKYKLKWEDTKEMHEKVLGKTLGQRVVKKWKEDFIDEDSGEVVNIERKEVVLDIRTVIEESELEVIIDANPEHISLYR